MYVIAKILCSVLKIVGPTMSKIITQMARCGAALAGLLAVATADRNYRVGAFYCKDLSVRSASVTSRLCHASSKHG